MQRDSSQRKAGPGDVAAEAPDDEAAARRLAEERVAHLERAVEELSDEVVRQGRALARVERQLDRLIRREAEREAEAGTPPPLADQRPPHW